MTGSPLLALVFRDPALLLLALAAPLALLWRRRGRAAALPFAPFPLLPQGADRRGFATWRTRLVSLPAWLQAAAIVLAAVALARPAERSPAPLVTEGIDVLLCLDVSSSMETEFRTNVPGTIVRDSRSRVEVAKRAAERFVMARDSDRIGLITFARYPEVRCPATLDHEALRRILRTVTTVKSDGPEDATGIGTAVARAAQALAASGGKSKVVVLLTDGEENVATEAAPGEIAPAHAAQLCERLGVRVHAIVAGGGRVAPDGRVVKPDSRALARLAERTGGEFHEAPTAAALAAVYETIDALERTRFEEPRFALADRFLPFLLAALLLLAVGRLLETTALEVLP